MRLDRYNAERAVLEVELRPFAKGFLRRYQLHQRLFAPPGGRCAARALDFLNELVAAGPTKDAKLEFLLSDVPKKTNWCSATALVILCACRFESGVSDLPELGTNTYKP